MRHVCVVGGGAAGAVAALAAREAGARVTLVRRAFGATALSSGAVDLAGAPDELPGDPWRGRTAAERNLREMLRRNPRHPLAVARLADRAAEALDAFARAVAPLYDARPFSRPDLVLPTDLGTWKSTFLAQRAQARADLAALDGKRVAVVGLRGWGVFHAPFVAASLERLARAGGVRVTMTPVEVALDDADLPLREPHEVARRVERDAGFVEALGRASEGFALALAPPVLGFEAPIDAGDRVAEVLASDRSVPGLRLQRALDRALEAAGVDLRAGDGPAGDADAIVLATGRFLGGGIAREGAAFHERVAGAPVFVDGEPAGEVYLGDLCGRDAAGPHAWMRAGLRVDDGLRPIDLAGRPLRENLFAAGAVIGGWDAVGERCGLGTAIVTGWAAGRAAAGAA